MNKTLKSKIILYTLIVLIPTLICSIFYLNFLKNQDELERKNSSKWIGTIHQRYWDTFTNETMTSLKILSFSSLIESNDKFKSLLVRTHQADPRFGGLYLLNLEGKVIVGSNGFLNEKDLSTEDYFQNAIKTKDTIISDNCEIMINKQKIVGLATPVLDEHQELKAILLANLRIDYIENTMKILSPEEKIQVINSQNKEIISLNKNLLPTNQTEWISNPIDRLPWSILVEVYPQNTKKLLIDLSKFTLAVFIFANILFLLSKYFLLKRQTKKELAQNEVQKLELVGTLAASSAHEIRNPLTGIKGLIQLLSEKYNKEEDQYYFSVINTEIARINEIVSEFLILGKPTAQKVEKIDLRKIIHEVEPLILSEGNLNNISCKISMPPTPINIICTKDQMKQVILNITRNAFDSMDQDGYLNIALAQIGQHCQLVFTDTGIGIPKEDIRNIFVPFFTSKDTGTGLGLVVCKQIIHSFSGSIKVESQEGKGTMVIINLPLSK